MILESLRNHTGLAKPIAENYEEDYLSKATPYDLEEELHETTRASYPEQKVFRLKTQLDSLAVSMKR
jgi:hypothetical protein